MYLTRLAPAISISKKLRRAGDISCVCPYTYWDSDKSLARPGRNQATATKFYNFCKPLKKKSEGCPSKHVSAAAMTSDEKWRPLNCFFQSGRAKDLSAPPYFTSNTTEQISTKFRINCLYQILSRSTLGSVSMNCSTALLCGVQISRSSVNTPPPPNSSLCLRIQQFERKYKCSQDISQAACNLKSIGTFFQFCVSVHHIMKSKNTSLMQLISIYFTYSKSLHVSGRTLPIIRRI